MSSRWLREALKGRRERNVAMIQADALARLEKDMGVSSAKPVYVLAPPTGDPVADSMIQEWLAENGYVACTDSDATDYAYVRKRGE